jgi:hypothetical protein
VIKTVGTVPVLIVYYMHTVYIQAGGVDSVTVHFQGVGKCIEGTVCIPGTVAGAVGV